MALAIWNSADKTFSTLSAGDSIATGNTGGSVGLVRSAANFSSGKWYFEGVGNWANVNSSFGMCKSSVTLAANLGGPTPDGGFTINRNGNVFYNNVTAISGVPGWSTSARISWAVDFDAKLAWVRFDAGNWNNSGTANPATGVGGLSFSATTYPLYIACTVANGDATTLRQQQAVAGAVPVGFMPVGALTNWGNTAGTNRGEDISVTALTATGTYLTVGIAADFDGNTLSAIVTPDAAFNTARSISGVTGAKFPILGLDSTTEVVEANFGASAFEHAMPAGHSAWDATCTWNPSDKDASITLSGGNLIATGTVAAWRAVRGTVSHTTGKWYFEVKIRLNSAADTNMIGVGNASAVLNNYPNFTANGACYQSNGNFGTNNGFTLTTRSWDEFVNNWRTIRSDVAHNGGRWYVEVLINALSSAGAGVIAGVMNSLGPLRSYLGSDAAGNSAGFQASRAYLRANGVTGNVLPAAITATHVLGLDINLDTHPPTIAGRLDGGTWSAAQDISSIFYFTGSTPTDIYLAVSLLDAPSTYDSVTVNFGATAFTYTAPSGAVGWDAPFGSTVGSVSGMFVEAMYAPPVPDVQVSGMAVEVLRTPVAGSSDIQASGAFVEVLRTAVENPVYQVGMFVDVMFESPAASIQNAGMFVEVLRVSELPPPGARGFNRAVTIIT